MVTVSYHVNCGQAKAAYRQKPRIMKAEVFALLVDDLDAATIAQRLSVSNATVHTHISHVYTKFGVHSRKELERVVQAGN